MLKAKAEIKFTIKGRDFDPKYIRPIFNLGDNILISGVLSSPDELYLNNQNYDVIIDFFTVTPEAYSEIHPCLKPNTTLAMQEDANRIIGIAKIYETI